MDTKELHAFADNMIELGRSSGYILGLKRAIEILRKHGIGVLHPARLDIYSEMMDSTQAGVTAYSQGAFNASPPPPAAA